MARIIPHPAAPKMMSRYFRVALATAALASAPVAPAALRAQTPAPVSGAADSLAFPRQFVKWVFSAQGDSAIAHAAPSLRESMKSAADVNEMSARVAARFGESKGNVAEVQFDEGPLKVYIVAINFAQAPEPGAWLVAYSPSTKIVERASFGPLSNLKARYPQAKLP
jgi:hypothetical protein